MIFVIRGVTLTDARQAAERAILAGARAVELTMTVPNAPTLLTELRRRHQHVMFGAGTVLSLRQADEMTDQGAEFVVSPGFDPTIVHTVWERGIPMLAGVQTPTEIMAAVREGATVVKLFPAGPYAPALLTTLRGPFPTMRFVPSGGIAADAVPDWFSAGASAVGIGVGMDRPTDVDLRALAAVASAVDRGGSA